MDENQNLSWRARLAKSNINILNIDDERWYYEFMYHPYPSQTKWCKTYFDIPHSYQVPDEDPVKWVKQMSSSEEIARRLQAEVLKLRKELER